MDKSNCSGILVTVAFSRILPIVFVLHSFEMACVGSFDQWGFLAFN